VGGKEGKERQVPIFVQILVFLVLFQFLVVVKLVL
jgi:hypothetical protein